MKRLTIAISEDVYRQLVDYAAERSKREIRRYSVGEAVREILASALAKPARMLRRRLCLEEPVRASPREEVLLRSEPLSAA